MDSFESYLDSPLGQYTSNAISISISEEIDLLVNDTADEFEVHFEESERPKFAIFLHEYWHYLLNTSTFSRYHDFSICFHILALFSSTLETNKNGISDGNKNLRDDQKELLSSFICLLRIYRGDSRPKIEGSIHDFRVLGYTENESKIKFQENIQLHPSILLQLEIDSTNGKESTEFLLGNIAIEEGLVTLIEDFIFESKPPLFPYRVIPKLVDSLVSHPIPKTDLISIITLSLLTPNPAISLISLIHFFDENCRHKLSSNDRRVALIEQVKDKFEFSYNFIAKELAEIDELVKHRTAFEMSSKVFGSAFRKMLKIRKANFLFDLEPFLSGELLSKQLEKFINLYPPCDVIQRRNGDEDKIERDSLLTFQSPVLGKELLTSYLKPFQAALKYMFSHLNSDGFKSSDEATCQCPFYTICGLSYRKNHPSLCKTKPWELYEIQENDLCWFNQGVASLLGTSKTVKD